MCWSLEYDIDESLPLLPRCGCDAFRPPRGRRGLLRVRENGTVMFLVALIPGTNRRMTLPPPVMSGVNVSMSALEGMAQNFLGIGLGAGQGCQAASGACLGRRTGGTDPISCSSKQSSAMSLVIVEPLSAGRFLNNPRATRGSETVADWEYCGCSRELRLAETTGTDGLGGDMGLRPP
jgi:hypothetical protein